MNKYSLIPSFRASAALFLLMTLLAGVAYPLAVTALARGLFPTNAGGSLIEKEGAIVGSSLLGQPFSQPYYFWGRLSAGEHNAAASGASHLSPASTRLLDAANNRIAALQKADAKNTQPVPLELITASGSGLDPHISPAAAEYQLGRVARARRMEEGDLRALVEAHTEGRTLWLLGEPRVNVLLLNLALDEKAPLPAAKRK